MISFSKSKVKPQKYIVYSFWPKHCLSYFVTIQPLKNHCLSFFGVWVRVVMLCFEKMYVRGNILYTYVTKKSLDFSTLYCLVVTNYHQHRAQIKLNVSKVFFVDFYVSFANFQYLYLRTGRYRALEHFASHFWNSMNICAIN